MKYIFIAILLLALPVHAQEQANLYFGKVTNVIDGDTVDMKVLIWVKQEIVTRIRLAGIDTPEISGKCDAEKALAKKARDRLVVLTLDKVTILEAIPYNKKATGTWERVIGTLYTPTHKNINQMLIDEGLGRPYNGGKRKGWC